MVVQPPDASEANTMELAHAEGGRVKGAAAATRETASEALRSEGQSDLDESEKSRKDETER